MAIVRWLIKISIHTFLTMPSGYIKKNVVTVPLIKLHYITSDADVPLQYTLKSSSRN